MGAGAIVMPAGWQAGLSQHPLVCNDFSVIGCLYLQVDRE